MISRFIFHMILGFTSIIPSFGRAICHRYHVVWQIADKIAYLKLIFTKCKAVIGCLYNTRTIVLHSHTGLSSDVFSKLQDNRKCGSVTVVQFTWAVVEFVALLLCNKTQFHRRVNSQQSCRICSQSAWARALTLVVLTPGCLSAALQQPCVSCCSRRCVFMRIAREISMLKIEFLS